MRTDRTRKFLGLIQREGPTVRPELGCCWLWLGGRHSLGYGSFRLSSGASAPPMYAHRISWMVHRGEDPGGSYVLHKCDDKLCVNPDHLYLGTHADNMADVVARGIAKGTQVQAGDLNPNAKLTWDDVEKIRGRLAAGERRADIARQYGVTPQAIGRIKRGGWQRRESCSA